MNARARVQVASRLNLATPPGPDTIMGFYRERILPRLLHYSERVGAVEAMRQRVVECAAGHVLEIGVGTGSTLFYYPRTIVSLTTVEPNPAFNARLRQRMRHLPFPVDIREGRAERLPVREAAFDCAISSFVLGAVEQPERAVAEIFRVLKPGGRLLFVEQGPSGDASVLRWQQRIDRVQRLVSGGNRLLLKVDELLLAGGFTLARLEMTYLARLPRALGCVYEGTALKPS